MICAVLSSKSTLLCFVWESSTCKPQVAVIMLRTLLTSSPTRGKHRISRHKIQLLLPVLQKESCNKMPAVLRRQRCSALRKTRQTMNGAMTKKKAKKKRRNARRRRDGSCHRRSYSHFRCLGATRFQGNHDPSLDRHKSHDLQRTVNAAAQERH